MVGKGVLLECLDDPGINSVLGLSRSTSGIAHPKFKEIIVKDFFDLKEIEDQLQGYDACFFCIGISSFRMKEEEYKRITYDLTLHFARTFIKLNESSIFCYVTGAGTDSSEKGSMMWARVKGKTENELLAMPFKKAYMFRPGYIQPGRGIESKTALYDTLYKVFKPVYYILKHFPSTATNTTNLGKAMINTLQLPEIGPILNNREINLLAENMGKVE